jgi:hypothetical protein
MMKAIFKNVFVFSFFLSSLLPAQVFADETDDAQRPGYSVSRVKTCKEVAKPDIVVEHKSGELLVSQAKSSVEIAREKRSRYNEIVPLRQGAIGHTSLHAVVKPKLEPYYSPGCLAMRELVVEVTATNNIQIAREYTMGTCMYDEFYNLEQELILNDEEIISAEILRLKHFLKQAYEEDNTFGPFPNDKYVLHKITVRKQIQAEVDRFIDTVKQKLAAERMALDLPEYFNDIQADCGGQ